MIIKELIPDHFRNLENHKLEFSENGHLLIGDNGQGKTNLLEAIYFLTLLKSFRGSVESECICFASEYFSLRGKWQDDSGDVDTIAIGFDGKRKKVSVSGNEEKKISRAFGRFKSIVLTPEDISIIQGGPALRRRYLDIVLSISVPQYLARLRRYKKALCSRNALLKRRFTTASQLLPWEEQMAGNGAFLVRQRALYLDEIRPLFEELFARLGSAEAADISYRSDLLPGGATGRQTSAGPKSADEEDARSLELDEQKIAGSFALKLDSRREVELERGTSLSGPQTDDIYFGLAGKPLRSFGSQGQQRTAVISLKMAEAQQIKKKSGATPVLLLDDIFSELDRRRSGKLLESLVEKHQSFITAPRKEVFFKKLDHLPVGTIKGGKVDLG